MGVTIAYIIPMENQLAKTQNQVARTTKVAQITVVQAEAIRQRETILRTRHFVRVEITDQEVEAVYNGLNQACRNKLSNGHLLKELKAASGLTTKEVRLRILRNWLELGQKCPYTNLPLNLIDSEVDHIEGYTENGSKASRLDNVVLVDRDVNQIKWKWNLDQFVERVLETPLDIFAQKRLEAEANVNLKTNLKDSLKDDVKALDASTIDQIIAKYGKHSYQINRELGFRIGFAKFNTERPRTEKWSMTVKKVKVGDEVLRCFTRIDHDSQTKLIEFVNSSMTRLENGADKKQVNQEILEFTKTL